MKIVKKQTLAENSGIKVTEIEVASADIAKKTKAGQFVVLIVSEKGERIPLTVVDIDLNKGTITLIFQEVGLTTKLLGKLGLGDSLYSLTGPLGHPSEIKNYGKVILVGGGVGIAEVYPVASALKEANNHITTILGARTKELLILEKELKAVSEAFYIATDDGSYGRKGFNADILEELIRKDKYDLVYAVGPIPMMKKIASLTEGKGIKTLVSLNALMVDGTGMCGCCRVAIGGQTRFSCVDGPDFDAHLVGWDELIKRNRIYLDKEKHICSLKIQA